MRYLIACPFPDCCVPITYERSELYTQDKSVRKQCPACKRWVRLEMHEENVTAHWDAGANR